METKCLECRHFGIGDGDPVCYHPTAWRIELPDSVEDCDKHEREEMEKKIELNKEEWKHYAPEFFKRYFIDKTKAETYLKYHPEHEDMISILGIDNITGR